jgi:hypothetical protein
MLARNAEGWRGKLIDRLREWINLLLAPVFEVATRAAHDDS